MAKQGTEKIVNFLFEKLTFGLFRFNKQKKPRKLTVQYGRGNPFLFEKLFDLNKNKHDTVE